MSDTDLLQLVIDGMGWDKKKAQRWFTVSNPLLGGATPTGYELKCGKMKLEKFIRTLLGENHKPDCISHVATLNRFRCDCKVDSSVEV